MWTSIYYNSFNRETASTSGDFQPKKPQLHHVNLQFEKLLFQQKHHVNLQPGVNFNYTKRNFIFGCIFYCKERVTEDTCHDFYWKWMGNFIRCENVFEVLETSRNLLKLSWKIINVYLFNIYLEVGWITLLNVAWFILFM